MKRNTLSVSFFIKKNLLLKNGEAPVALRITVNGKREEIRIKRSIDPSLWLQTKEFSKGKSKASIELNEFINESRIRINQIFEELEQKGVIVTAESVKNRFLGSNDDVKCIVAYFGEHNERCRKLIGKDYVDITVRRYECCARYIGELIWEKYKLKDLPLSDINGEFIRDLELYLKTQKGISQNTLIRYMTGVKKITTLAYANGYMARDPFSGIKFKAEKIQHDFLTTEEIERLMKKDDLMPNMEATRDVFLFCCHTGLAYIDVFNLKEEHLVKDNNGVLWIRKARQKTDNMCDIPLLSYPNEILAKYADHKGCKKKGTLLPVLSNQKMNQYLKDLATLCRIKKNFTTHTARRTFATTVALANGVALPNIAKMLGHSNTRMTEHYAKVMDGSILKDMIKVENVISQS